MAIAKNPKRNRTDIQTQSSEEVAQAFISGANPPANDAVTEISEIESSSNKKPIMVRIDPVLLKRIDIAAKRIGISRSAFLVSSAAERLDRSD